MWDGINSLINRKKKNRKSIGSIRPHDDQLSQDPLDHANISKGHFASVGPKLASSIPNSNTLFTQYLPKINFNGSFVFEPVLPTEIELELMRTPSNKSHGLWSCPTRLASDKLGFYLFADDTNLLYADRNLKSLDSVVNVELLNVCDWLSANQLFLNIKKTSFVICHPYQKRLDYEVKLKIYDNQMNTLISIERKSYVKVSP